MDLPFMASKAQAVHINYYAVLVSAALYHALGALWYSKALFADKWTELSKITPEQIEQTKARGMGKVFLTTFIAGLLTCTAVALVIHYSGARTFGAGLRVGAVIAFGLVAATQLADYLFSGRGVKLYFINAGYHCTGVLIASTILAMWR